MAVANRQVEELVEVFKRHVDQTTTLRLLCGMARTEAFDSAKVSTTPIPAYDDPQSGCGRYVRWNLKVTW